MFMVPMRQQSLTQEPSRSWWGGLGFLLPCLGSWHWGRAGPPLWGAGMVVPGMGTGPGQGPAVPASWFAACSLPCPNGQDQTHPRSRLAASLPRRGPAAPHNSDA